MSIVNTETGELVEFDRAAAERRAERITLRLDAIADNYRAVLPMIREAIEKRDDLALGYRSPGDYVSDRFGQALAGLGIEVRRAVVGELTQAGLSTRAIAPVVGVSNKTVHADREALAGVTSVTPAEREQFDREHGFGRRGPHAPEGEATDAGRQQTAVEAAPSVPRPPVTGIDGKTYTPPATRQAQRDDAELLLNRVQSLADQAAREAHKVTASQLARIKPKADLWTVGLRDSVETLQRLLTSLTEEK